MGPAPAEIVTRQISRVSAGSVGQPDGRAGVSQGCKKKTQIVKNLEKENGDGKVMAREKFGGGMEFCDQP